MSKKRCSGTGAPRAFRAFRTDPDRNPSRNGEHGRLAPLANSFETTKYKKSPPSFESRDRVYQGGLSFDPDKFSSPFVTLFGIFSILWGVHTCNNHTSP